MELGGTVHIAGNQPKHRIMCSRRRNEGTFAFPALIAVDCKGISIDNILNSCVTEKPAPVK